jgi:6-pyruvoyltetrahydropterin/6-carboxytetrahydropterin synthase
MAFLCSDTRVLPIVNATVEEFARYLLGRLRELSPEPEVRALELCVSSGPGQCGCASWQAD